MDYTKTARDILERVGGTSNVSNVEHCMTRLRFNLVDESRAKTAEIEALPGVLGVVNKGGQYQVILGGLVPRVFAAYQTITAGDAPATAPAASSDPDGAAKVKKPGLFARILDALSGTFTPILPAIIGAGMLKGLLSTLVVFGALDTTSSTYVVLNAIGDGAFYFLPMLIAASAAKKFGMNPFVALAVAAAALHPSLTALMTTATAEGTALDFFGLPVQPATYSSSVIAMFITIYLASFIERFFDRWIHNSVRVIFSPMLTVLVTVTLFITIIGPLGAIAGTGLAQGITWLFENSGPLAGMVLSAAWAPMVMVGMHYAVVPVFIESLATQGYDYILVCITIANLAQGAAAFGAVARVRNKATRPISITAAITALFGVTEPVIYGVNLKYRRTFVAGLIGAGLAGGVALMFQAKAYVFVKPGIQGIPMFIGETFWFAIAALVIALVASFLIAYFWGVSPGTDIRADAGASATTPGLTAPDGSTIVLAPVAGSIGLLTDLDDKAFSSGILGAGVVIEPTDGRFVSPVNGRVASIFRTNHAIMLVSDEGLEILIHVGIDTVHLAGAHFTPLVSAGDDVEVGTPLLDADLDAIRAKGYAVSTPVVVTNLTEVSAAATSSVRVGDPLFTALVPVAAAR